jgi:hypothetical protein
MRKSKDIMPTKSDDSVEYKIAGSVLLPLSLHLPFAHISWQPIVKETDITAAHINKIM